MLTSWRQVSPCARDGPFLVPPFRLRPTSSRTWGKCQESWTLPPDAWGRYRGVGQLSFRYYPSALGVSPSRSFYLLSQRRLPIHGVFCHDLEEGRVGLKPSSLRMLSLPYIELVAHLGEPLTVLVEVRLSACLAAEIVMGGAGSEGVRPAT